jgi:NitT/TauT family transport system permease protein
MKRILPPLLVFIVTVAALEITVRELGARAFLIPRPSEVFADILRNTDHLWAKTRETGLDALLGLGLSAVLGVGAAIVLSSAQWIQRAFYPYAVFFQTVPIIAIAPLLVIWLGYGQPTVIASAFIVSIFPMIANTLAGLVSTEPGLRDMFRLYGAGRIATLWKLRLPAALPQIMTGLRISSGLAVIGAIVGEFIGNGGLGEALTVALRHQQPDVVFAAVILASLLGLAMFGVVNLLSHVVLGKWHPSEKPE